MRGGKAPYCLTCFCIVWCGLLVLFRLYTFAKLASCFLSSENPNFPIGWPWGLPYRKIGIFFAKKQAAIFLQNSSGNQPFCPAALLYKLYSQHLILRLSVCGTKFSGRGPAKCRYLVEWPQGICFSSWKELFFPLPLPKNSKLGNFVSSYENKPVIPGVYSLILDWNKRRSLTQLEAKVPI